MRAKPFITLTTDFGIDDVYAGVMKGVILSINPACRIVDITHMIAPQDVLAGAFALESAVPYFPEGTIHVAVVDPGVGSSRRPVVIETQQCFFVGPDNGIFSFALAEPGHAEVHELTARDYFLPHPSATFHGRDLFAPAAAHLSCGVAPAKLGRAITDPVMLPAAAPCMRNADEIQGMIMHIDRFGNLITNIRGSMLEGFVHEARIRAACRGVAITKFLPAYTHAQQTEPFCLIGSTGRLEVSVKNGSAARVLGACRGEPVVLRRL